MECGTGGERFNRRDRAIADGSHAGDAGADGGAVEQERACAALAFAASEVAPRQAQIVSKDEEQAVARLGVNLVLTTVHVEQISSHRAF
jgi:hypothetical protein